MYCSIKKLLYLICLFWVTCSICASAAMDPRFKTMALPEGTRLEVIGPVVAALRMNPETNSPFAKGCDTRYSSPSTGTRSQFIIRITENKITNVKDVFDAPAEMLWSKVVLEGNEGCYGWVWMNDSLRFEDSLLHRWRALAKNPPQSLVINKSSANAVTSSVSDVTIKKTDGDNWASHPRPRRTDLPSIGQIVPLLEASGLFKEPSVRSEDLSRRCIHRNQLNESPKFEIVEIRELDESTTYKKISREWIKLRSLVDASCSGWSPSRDVVSSMRNSGIKPDAQNTTGP